MAETPPIPQDTESPSYTKMSVGDVEAVGARCEAPFCAWAAARRQQSQSQSPLAPKPTILTHDQQCSRPDCKTLINTPLSQGVRCQLCSRDYCLKHRFKDDHECDNIPKPRPSDGGVGNALAKLRSWGQSRKSASAGGSSPSPRRSVNVTASLERAESSPKGSKLQRIVSPFKSKRPSKPSAAIVQVNALKKSAKGDMKIPPDSRIYVHLEAVAEGEGVAGAKIPKADAFYSKDWSVGKILDAAATTLAVTNVNNRGGGEEQRLRVFYVDGGKLLPFSDKLSATGVKNGDTLVLLRGVGAAEAGS
ncbi:MAG: hypothetical protein Q9162_004952 [Coniocarpon cinnabarinum]